MHFSQLAAALSPAPAAPQPTPFEGVEKRLIVRFSDSVFDHPDAPYASLRDVPDDAWSKLLESAACTILSKVSSDETIKRKKKARKQRMTEQACTAYLLSESSLFVYDRKCIIKTCGTTTPLLALDPLFDLALAPKLRATATAEEVCDLAVFSRLNYKFPEAQRFPHRSFNEEVEYLNRYWPSGESFQLPTAVNRDFNVFLHASPAFIKVASAAPSLTQPGDNSTSVAEDAVDSVNASSLPARERDLDITEIMMLGVNERCVDFFAGDKAAPGATNPPVEETAEGEEGANAVPVSNHIPQANTALKKLLPAVGTRLDQFWFSPFGYSCNAVSRSFFLNSHISPEPAASYASVETNYPFGHVSYHEFAAATMRCFEPTEVHVVQFRLNTTPFKEPPMPHEFTHPAPHHTTDAPSKDPLSSGFQLKRRVDANGSWYRLSHCHYTRNDAAPPTKADRTSLATIADRHSAPPSGLPSAEPSRMSIAPSSQGAYADSAKPFDVRVFEHTRLIEEEAAGLPEKRLAEMAAKHNVPQVLRGAFEDGDAERGCLQAIVEGEGLDEPVCLIDLQKVVKQYQRWRKVMPRVTPFYAMKCNGDPLLVRTLVACGARVDCASKAEIREALEAGVSPEQVIYSNPCKQTSNLEYARAVGVRVMVFDSIDELKKIKGSHPHAQLLLRVRCDDGASQCPMSGKFGAPHSAWPALLRAAKEHEMEVVGVSFHVGSGCTQEGAYRKPIRDARMLFDLGASLGFKMELLDLGGGYPGALEGEGATGGLTFEALGADIMRTLDTHFPEGCGVAVIAEPGRYFAHASHALAVRIFNRRKPLVEQTGEKQEGEEKREARMGGSTDDQWLYYANDGVYGSFNCIVFDHAHVTPELLKPKPDAPVHGSTLFGPTCDGFDLVLENHPLPEMEVGEWLLFRNMGAYTTAAGSTFNGFSGPHSRYVRIGE